MSKNPEWMNKAQVHNALTVLYFSLLAQPLIIFGILYWLLTHGTDYSQIIVIALASFAAAIDYLFLLWVIKKLKGNGNRRAIRLDDFS